MLKSRPSSLVLVAGLSAALLVAAGCGTRQSSEATRAGEQREAGGSDAPDEFVASLPAEDPALQVDGIPDDDGTAPSTDPDDSDGRVADPGGGSAPSVARSASSPRRTTAAAAPRSDRPAESGRAQEAASPKRAGEDGRRAASHPGDPDPVPAPGGGKVPGPKDSPVQGDEPIIIGNVGTYTGPAGGSLKRFPEGVQVWVRWINDRGGINGHPVKLFVVDDGGDPARHRAAKQDLVERKGVQAFVGNGEPLAGESSVDYITKKGIPMVGNEGGSDWYYDSPMYFPQAPNGDTYWYSMMPGLAEVAGGKTKFASVACVEAETACGGADRVWHDQGAAKANGFSPVYRARASLAQPDYTAECLNAQRAGAEIMVLVLDDTSIGRFAGSCGRQGYHPMYAWPLAPAATRHKDDPNLDGAVVLLDFFPWTKGDTPATAEFQAAMKKYFSGTVEPGHAGGWASGKMFEKAARVTPTPHLAAGILDGLYSFEGETLGGLTMPLRFERGKPATRTECWGQLLIRDGKYVPLNDGAIRCR